VVVPSLIDNWVYSMMLDPVLHLIIPNSGVSTDSQTDSPIELTISITELTVTPGAVRVMRVP
jgi:hypothetical protein